MWHSWTFLWMSNSWVLPVTIQPAFKCGSSPSTCLISPKWGRVTGSSSAPLQAQLLLMMTSKCSQEIRSGAALCIVIKGPTCVEQTPSSDASPLQESAPCPLHPSLLLAHMAFDLSNQRVVPTPALHPSAHCLSTD